MHTSTDFCVAILFNSLMKKYHEQKRWLMWKYKTVNGKITKVPYTITNRPADSTDPTTWSTYDEVKKASTDSKIFSGIGIVFTHEKTLLGIDLDHVLDKGTATLLSQFEKDINYLLTEANTYTEISPSGEGLHLYIAITEPLTLIAKKHAPYEVYTEGRFFTFSGVSYYETQLPVRTISLKEAESLLSIIGYPWGKTHLSYSENTTELIGDDELLKRMFESKNGAKIKKLYDGDLSYHKNDKSSADAALLCHLAFWTRKNATQMERLWISSPLGKREKTLKRKDYRDRSIQTSIANTNDVYRTEHIELLYTLSPKGERIYTQNTENMCRILRHHPEFKGKIRFDKYKDQMEIYKNDEWQAFGEETAIIFQTRISILFECFRRVGKEMISDAILHVAKENSIDSAVDFITSLKWDGIERLNNWLSTVYGVKDSEYHRKVGSNWVKGLVNLIINPQCKF